MLEPTASGRRLAVSICGPYGCRASILHGVFRESRPLVLGHVCCFNLAHYTLHPPRYIQFCWRAAFYPADHHVFGFGMRLHQSYRSLQQAKSSGLTSFGSFPSTDVFAVCLARKLGARLPHLVIPTVRPMDSVPPQRAFSCIQRQQVCSFQATCLCSDCCFVESGIKIICTMRQKSSGH